MPLQIIQSTPQDFHLDDLFQYERWMCSNCGLILDYKFEPGEAGWPRFDPPLGVSDFWIDDEGKEHYAEPERKEFCPRCDIPFEQSPPVVVTIREITKLSDFFQPGDGESTTTDFKENFSTDTIKHTIAAFAQTQGGKFILGIKKKGVPIGYQGEEKIDTTEGKDKLQERIRGLLNDIEPRVQVRVYFVDNDAGLHFAVIVVPKGTSPLYSVNRKFYIRDVDQTRGLTAGEVLEITGRWHETHKKP